MFGRRVLLFLFLTIFLTPTVVPALAQAAADKNPVRLLYVEWDCAKATTHLAKAAIEDRLGRKVETISVTAAAMWVGLASGDADAMLTAWLPVTHKEYLQKVQGKVTDLGPLATGARLAWTVPEYVSVTTIENLNEHAAKFNGRIVGIDPGAGYMSLSEKALKEYGLKNFELQSGSDATMTAALADAIRRKEWIVVLGWSPHWMFGRWKLHTLDDPKKVFGETETINTFARLGLEKDIPEVYAFLDRFHYEHVDQLQTLMGWNTEKGADLLANARRFMKEHPELVNSWFEGGKN